MFIENCKKLYDILSGVADEPVKILDIEKCNVAKYIGGGSLYLVIWFD